MSEVRDIENSIINAAADKLVSLGVEGSQLSVAGKESKTQVSQGRKIMTLLKAYRRRSELSDGQVDSILYCLKYLSGQSSFPTSVPLVGKSSSSQIKLFSSIKFFDEGVLFDGFDMVLHPFGLLFLGRYHIQCGIIMRACPAYGFVFVFVVHHVLLIV